MEMIESVAMPEEREKIAFASFARSASSSRRFTSAEMPATPAGGFPIAAAGGGLRALGRRWENLRYTSYELKMH